MSLRTRAWALAQMHTKAPQGAPEWVNVHWLLSATKEVPAHKGALSRLPPLGKAQEGGSYESQTFAPWRC